MKPRKNLGFFICLQTPWNKQGRKVVGTEIQKPVPPLLDSRRAGGDERNPAVFGVGE